MASGPPSANRIFWLTIIAAVMLAAVGSGLLLLPRPGLRPTQPELAPRQRASIHAPPQSTPEAISYPPFAPEIEKSAEELISTLREILKTLPVDEVRLRQTRERLFEVSGPAAQVLVRTLLREPLSLKNEPAFAKEVESLLGRFETPQVLLLYISTVPDIDKTISVSGLDLSTGKALLIALHIFCKGLADKATELHVAPLVSVIPTISQPRVRQGLVLVLQTIFARLKDSRIRDLMLKLIHDDPDSEVRTLAVIALAPKGDPAILSDLITQLMKLGSLERSKNLDEARELARGIIDAIGWRESFAILEAALRDSRNNGPAQMAGRAIADAFRDGQLEEEALGEILARLKAASCSSDQLMYVTALQGIDSKDPRLLDTLKDLASRDLPADVQVNLFGAIGARGSSQDLIKYAGQGMATRPDLAIGGAALAMNLYAVKHPEDSAIRESILEHARHSLPRVRRAFVSHMGQVSPRSPNLFGDVLQDIAANDPDPGVRRAATAALRSSP